MACRAIYKDKALLGISPTGNAAFRSAPDGRERAVQQRFRPTFPVAHPRPFPTGNDARSLPGSGPIQSHRSPHEPSSRRVADSFPLAIALPMVPLETPQCLAAAPRVNMVD